MSLYCTAIMLGNILCLENRLPFDLSSLRPGQILGPMHATGMMPTKTRGVA